MFALNVDFGECIRQAPGVHSFSDHLFISHNCLEKKNYIVISECRENDKFVNHARLLHWQQGVGPFFSHLYKHEAIFHTWRWKWKAHFNLNYRGNSLKPMTIHKFHFWGCFLSSTKSSFVWVICTYIQKDHPKCGLWSIWTFKCIWRKIENIK